MNGIPILNKRLQYLESLSTSGAAPWDSSRLESARHERPTRPNHLHESICNPDSMDLDAIIENKLQRRMERFSLENYLFNTTLSGGGAQGKAFMSTTHSQNT